MHRVVIVGCGFAGLSAARALRGAPVEVVVMDRTNHHLFQALLYQVATGVLSEGDIAPPIRDVLRHQRNTRVVLGEVTDVDAGNRTLTVSTLGNTTTLPYDSLIVAAGASQSYFGHDEYALYAPGMNTIDDALELRGRIFGAFEMAELEPGEAERQPWLTFAIVGAGPTGVELAGQIAELSRRALRANFRRFDPAAARIVLIDALGTVLPAYPERLRRRAHRDLERLGVEIRLGTRVTGVDETGLDVSGGDGSPGRIGARTMIWAAGVQGFPARAAGIRPHGGRRRPRRPRGGPAGLLRGRPSRAVRRRGPHGLDGLRGLAEVAQQSGHHAARTIVRRLRGRDPKPFRYLDLGTMATIARFRAVASIGRLQITGLAAWLLWLGVVIEGRLREPLDRDASTTPNFNRERLWGVLRAEHNLAGWQAAHLWGPASATKLPRACCSLRRRSTWADASPSPGRTGRQNDRSGEAQMTGPVIRLPIITASRGAII